MAKHTEKTPEQIEADILRPKYFSPSEAVEYGIIDKVLSISRLDCFFLWGCFADYNLVSFCRFYTMTGALRIVELFLTLKRHSLFDCWEIKSLFS